ncbi:unnamed protein product, partial [Brassica napus]
GLVHRVTNRCGDACPCGPEEHKNKKRRMVKDEEEICCLSTCHVKVLGISEYGGSFQELKQMRHFLGKLECLETVKVCVDAEENNNNREVLRANLLSLPRLSSNDTAIPAVVETLKTNEPFARNLSLPMYVCDLSVHMQLFVVEPTLSLPTNLFPLVSGRSHQ